MAIAEVFCPPPDLKGREVMTNFEKFLQVNPGLTEKPYGDAMAASRLTNAFSKKAAYYVHDGDLLHALQFC